MPKSSKLYRLTRQGHRVFPGHTPGSICSIVAGVKIREAPMDNHLKHFKRELPGLWTCLTTVSIGGVTIPSGARVIAGMPYNGVDVGALLELEYASAHKGSGPP